MSNIPRWSALQQAANVPVIGYILRLGSSAARLPKKFDEINARLSAIQGDSVRTKLELERAKRQLGIQLQNLAQTLAEMHDRQLDLTQKVSDIKHDLNTLSAAGTARPAGNASEPASVSNLLADDHDLDDFYIKFENKFRGSEAEIKDRLRVYVPRLKKLGVDFSKHQLLDIGCGRGELLELLQEEGIKALGLDLNRDMVERCNKRGLEAVQAEALTYLQQQPSQSLGAITGFHIVEHIPFNFLLRLFEECYRVLIPGGVIIFETPNPENLHVGSFSFYYDPSHLHPLAPDVLAFAISNRGFDKTEILRLHPKGDGHENDHRRDRYVAEIVQRYNTAQDYAVIGRKTTVQARPRKTIKH